MKLDLLRLTGVEAVHSLNIWSLTMDKVVVSVHIAVGELPLAVQCWVVATQTLQEFLQVFAATATLL